MAGRREMHAQIRHRDVGIGIEPGNVEIFIEDGPEPEVASKSEPVVIAIDEQCVEQCEEQQGAQSQPAFIFAYLKEFKHHSTYSFQLFVF